MNIKKYLKSENEKNYAKDECSGFRQEDLELKLCRQITLSNPYSFSSLLKASKSI